MGFRIFLYLGHEWSCETLGAGGGSCGEVWGDEPGSSCVIFRCLSDPSRRPIVGAISAADPMDVSEDELRQALAEALIIDELDRANRSLTASEIAARTGLSEATVRESLVGMSDLVDWEYNDDDPSDDEPRYFVANPARPARNS